MARQASKRLTPKGVQALTTAGYHADSDAVGLYVQVAYRQRDGKLDKKHGITRSWVYRYTSPVAKRIRWMGLGSCDVIPLAEARDLAKAARRLVTLGADPIDHRNATVMAEREAYVRERARTMTFGACVDAYLAEHLASFRNAKHKWQWQETIGRASKAFGDLNVAAVDAPTVIKFLTPIWNRTPKTAARLRGRIEKVLDWAKVHQFRDGENPARWQGHLEHVFAAATGGDNYAAMPFDQVPALLARLRERDTASAKALELVILTATRSGEARGAAWDEIDLDKGLWKIPAGRMKAGKQHEVPLSNQALDLLKSLPRVGPYVFPGRKEGTPLSDFALRAELRVLTADRFTVHGFRSSFRDWAGERGVDREVAEHALAHQLPDKVEAAYRRGTSLPRRRQLMQTWADYLDGAVADNVVALRG